MDIVIKNKNIEMINTVNPKPTDTIVVRFKDIPVDELKMYCEQMQKIFPNNNVIALPDNAYLEVCSRELWNDYIQIINEYINNFI